MSSDLDSGNVKELNALLSNELKDAIRLELPPVRMGVTDIFLKELIEASDDIFFYRASPSWQVLVIHAKAKELIH